MKIQAVNSTFYQNKNNRICNRKLVSQQKADSVTFKGDKGALIGIATGAAVGAGIAAVTILTGGLAGVVAAVGAGGTILGGAAAGTHIGGITGSIIEDKSEKKDKNN